MGKHKIRENIQTFIIKLSDILKKTCCLEMLALNLEFFQLLLFICGIPVV